MSLKTITPIATVASSSGGGSDKCDNMNARIKSCDTEYILHVFKGIGVDGTPYERTKDYIIRILTEFPNILKRTIKITDIQELSMQQSIKDFKRERVIFNDVPFIPDKVDAHRGQAFVVTLRRYIERLVTTYNCSNNNKKSPGLSRKGQSIIDSKVSCDSDNSDISDEHEGGGRTASTPPRPVGAHVAAGSSSRKRSERTIIAGDDYDAVADIILNRSCRTNAGIDSYFLVQELFCVEGTFITHRTGNDPPTRVDVFVTHSGGSDGEGGDCLCSRIEVRNSYAIYDSDMMDSLTGQKDQDPPPWLDVETTVIDESNHKHNSHSRRLKITVTAPNKLAAGTVSFGNRDRTNSNVSTPVHSSTVTGHDNALPTTRNSTDNSEDTANNRMNRKSLFGWIKLR